jgi:hypothetical protein
LFAPGGALSKLSPKAQPFQHGHRCAMSRAVATCLPFL